VAAATIADGELARYELAPQEAGKEREEDVTMRSAHQSSLTHLGYDPGPVDGVVTQRTAEAISQYQYTNRLPVDGQPSPGLLDHMIRHGG
jgi:hypothetical protein